MYRSHDRPRLVLAGFFLVLGVAAVQGRYQKDPVKYKITVAAVKDGPSITLRPNVRQRVYVSITNPAATDAKLTVAFRAGGKVEATGKVEVGSNDTKLVKWDPIPAKKDAKDAKDGKDALDGPFEIVVAEKDGKPLASKQFVPLLTMSPFEYLNIADAGKGGTKKLSLRVSANDKFVGPSARVALDIPADRIKGERKGTFTGFVAAKGTTELVAEPIENTNSKELVDAYSLDVDGIKRGVLFRVTTVEGKSTVEIDNAGQAALLLPTYTRPAEKLTADVLTSGNIYSDDRVVVSVLSTPFNPASAAGDTYAPVATFVGPRQVRLRADVNIDGQLYLEPITAEHKVTLNLSGIFGKTKVRSAIYSADDFDDEGNLKPDVKIRAGTNESTQVITVSDTPPKLEFKALRRSAAKDKEKLEPTADVARGERVVFQATVASEAPVTEVRFVVGKMPADGKVPPDALKGQREGDTAVWSVEYPVPVDAKSPLEVTAVATNSLGLSAAKTVEFPVIDAIPGFATVAGKVFEADVPVDNLPVILLDTAGTEIAAVRSSGGGRFSLPNIPPGAYFLYARREMNGAKAMMEIAVRRPSRADPVGVDPKDIELLLVVPAELREKKDEKKDKKARITGTVVEDERVQGGVIVRLYDPTGRTVLATTKTNAAGDFSFKDLEKGKYIVVATKSASRTRARAVVELDAGETKALGDLKLFR
jgi:hypothetical protein